MNPYYEILSLMRRQTPVAECIAEGEIAIEPLRVFVMGEQLNSVRFMGHVGTGGLMGGERCLVYMGQEEYVVLGVF